MKKLFLFALLCFVVQVISAQTPKYRVLSVPVVRNGSPLRSPWVGGMNSPQFSPINLNGDGYKDLFVFDREGDKVLTFLNNGNGTDSAFDYAPKYESYFPKNLTAWAVIRDYNNDGVPDLFTHANAGTTVFKGSIQNNSLHFDTVSKLLMYNDGQFNVNIWTNVADIPVFTDVNRDGDIDVLTYGIFGATVNYYENQTAEHPGDPAYAVDSFKYVLVTQCWGSFSQNSASNSINLNISCKGTGEVQAHGADERHVGNSLYSFDADNDHDVDLLNGNIGYNNLMFLKNCGDSSNANVCSWDSLYPTCSTAIMMETYPAAFGDDVNNDQLEDLLIAPNVSLAQGQSSRDVHNVMYYRNTGNTSCQFEYETDSFLVRHLLDFGTDSKPVFYDFDFDGLPDLMVGNYGYFRPFQTYKSTVAYYRNTGTRTHPQFEMQSEDYGNISNYGFVAVYPAFGDLDGDSKPDMLIGELNGYLHFFKNTGSSTSTFNSLTTTQYFGIDVGQYSAPFIYDVNGDSLNDLVVGRVDGKISYYWNFGTKTNPLFSQDSVNNFFGSINVTQTGYPQGHSQPVVVKDNTGLKLLVGSYRGTVFEYALDTTKLRGGSFALIDSDFLKQDVGTKATITVAEITGDTLTEYVVGNSRGGLLMFSDSLWDTSTLSSVNEINTVPGAWHIYPNPANNYLVCEAENINTETVQVLFYNVLGERIITPVQQSGHKLTINTAPLASGFYILRIETSGQNSAYKVLIER